MALIIGLCGPSVPKGVYLLTFGTGPATRLALAKGHREVWVGTCCLQRLPWGGTANPLQEAERLRVHPGKLGEHNVTICYSRDGKAWQMRVRPASGCSESRVLINLGCFEPEALRWC